MLPSIFVSVFSDSSLVSLFSGWMLDKTEFMESISVFIFFKSLTFSCSSAIFKFLSASLIWALCKFWAVDVDGCSESGFNNSKCSWSLFCNACWWSFIRSIWVLSNALYSWE